MVGASAYTLSQAHFGGKSGKKEATGLQLFLKTFEAVGQNGHRFARALTEGAPLSQVIPEPSGAGGVVHGTDVVPEFDA